MRVTVGPNAGEVKAGRGTIAAMTARALLAAVLLAASGCATLGCEPLAIVVARTQERSRLESEFRGVRTDPQGRVSEVRRDVVVHEYWVQAADGRWYRVNEARWRAAEVGGRLEVCR